MDNGKIIDIVSTMAGEINTPFKTFDEVKFGLKEHQYMIQPIFNSNDEMYGIFQIESKQ